MPFLRAIPNEIEEAAAIDGMQPPRVLLAHGAPAVAARASSPSASWPSSRSWNSYLLPLFILNTQANFTLPLGVQPFSSQYSMDTAKVLAFTSLSMIPALVVLRLFQRRIVGGLTGAVKG